jgi:hypothetical protein
MGISNTSVSFEPSASNSRNHVLDLSYTDHGPVVLAYRVQKLSLTKAGKMSAKGYTDGAYFGKEEKEVTVQFYAELEDFDMDNLERVNSVGEIEGEKYGLWVASSLVFFSKDSLRLNRLKDDLLTCYAKPSPGSPL